MTSAPMINAPATNGSKALMIMGWALFGLIFVSTTYNIIESRANVKKIKKDEDLQEQKLAELELNLKQSLGDRYVVLGNQSPRKA